MNLQVVDLGLVILQLPDYEFSMKTFKDRHKLQKTLYLLQSFGIYLGYDFSWYLRGPYCPSLTINAFALQDIYDDIPKHEKVRFATSTAQEAFEKFQEFVKGKDIDDLEILASLRYQKQLGKNDDNTVKKIVKAKQDRFTLEKVNKMWSELEKWNLV